MRFGTADAVVIGSGPNGLVAAITLARKGWDVAVMERAPVPGGAVRTDELTEAGYQHDPFSAFYGLLHASPVFADLRLDKEVEWAHFDTPVGAAISPTRAAVIRTDPARTEIGLGSIEPADGEAWRALHAWWGAVGSRFFALTLAPIGAIRPALRFARATGLRGALPAARMLLAPAEDFVRDRFASEEARALVASGITHSDVSVADTGSLPMALILAMLAQDVGMPVPVGGSGALATALVRLLEDAGGEISTSQEVTRVLVEGGRAIGVETAAGDVVRARHAVIADTGAPRLFHHLVGDEHLPVSFLDGLRAFRYGSGIFKMDIALRAPLAWNAPPLRSAGVVHLSGRLDDMARAAFDNSRGVIPGRPSLIVGQQTLADPSRAPTGCHTLWIETHVPSYPEGGWAAHKAAFAESVLDLIEAHAPGARDLIAGLFVRTPHELELENPNLVGGDLGGGSQAFHQQLVFRPVPGWFRYRTPVKRLYLCSASAHPGGGVHGMGGRNCARRVLRDSRKPGGLVRTATGARRAPAQI